MSKFALEKNQAVVVTRTGSSEQLVKIEIVELGSDKVTLDFAAGPRVSVHTAEEWDRLQADRRAAKGPPGSDRPRQNAPYMN